MIELSVLIVDDDEIIKRSLKFYLKDEFEALEASTAEEALEIIRERHIDLVFIDYELPGKNGIELLKAINGTAEAIMITSHNNMDIVIESLRNNAIDFLKKPIQENDVKLAVERSKKYASLQRKLKEKERIEKHLKNQLEQELSFELVGTSPEIAYVEQMMVKVGGTRDTSVLITGENGTGKELVARGIHELSDRRDHNFVAVNMAAIPESLFESEFFGHKKGAFTGADSDRTGWLEIASEGTLFLDEIGEMPHSLQSKLLRVLEERSFVKVGGNQYIDFDVRIIAATNKQKQDLLVGNVLRPDLFHRLSAFLIDIPPLRERPQDIEILALHFLDSLTAKMNRYFSGFEQNALEKLQNYTFPGNVRELKNIVERAVILAEGYHIGAENIILNMDAANESVKSDLSTLDLEQLEIQAIKRALEICRYNKAQAAKMLNIKWNSLHRKMIKYNILKNGVVTH